MTIAAFLDRHPEFSAEPVEAPWFEPAGRGQFRMLPHKLLGEGHFGAVLRKNGGEETEVVPEKPQKLPKPWNDFARELGICLEAGKAVQFGQSLFWAPEEMPALRGIKVLRPGLELGQLKKDRFEPAHALALWLKSAENYQNLEGNSELLQQYMHGDVVPTTQKGWCLVTVDGYSLGWGKGDGKVLKNHYPKGLRR